MAHAKRQGGDRIEVFRPTMRSDAQRPPDPRSDLRRALERGEIKVLFQPIVRLEDRTIAGFEALLRWDHPRSAASRPQDFIAARGGDRPDRQSRRASLLERTARELAAWQERARGRSADLRQRQRVEPPAAAARSAQRCEDGARAHRRRCRGSLKLEMTESLVMENPEYSAQMLDAPARSRRRPVASTISAPAIRRSPTCSASPSTRSRSTSRFVRQMARGKPIILRSIIKMAHDLGMEVVAEGAETRVRSDRALSARLRIRAGPGLRRADVDAAGPPTGRRGAGKSGVGAAPDLRRARPRVESMRRIDADLAQRGVRSALDGRRRSARIGRAVAASRWPGSRFRAGPRPSRHSRAPARRFRPLAPRDRAQDVDRRGQADLSSIGRVDLSM